MRSGLAAMEDTSDSAVKADEKLTLMTGDSWKKVDEQRKAKVESEYKDLKTPHIESI